MAESQSRGKNSGRRLDDNWNSVWRGKDKRLPIRPRKIRRPRRRRISDRDLIRLLRDDVNVHRRGVAQKAINRIHVKKFSPAFYGGPAKDNLCYVLVPRKLRGCVGNILALQTNGFGSQAF